MTRLLLVLAMYAALVSPGSGVIVDSDGWACSGEVVGGQWLFSPGCQECGTDADCDGRQVQP